MSTVPRNAPIEGLKGAEQHHDLKNQPGEKGDPDHTETDGTLPEDVEAAIKNAEADNEMAAALKDAVKKD